MDSVTSNLKRRYRRLLLKYKNDPVATQVAIVDFYERKISELDPNEAVALQHLQIRLEQAYERLGAALGNRPPKNP